MLKNAIAVRLGEVPMLDEGPPHIHIWTVIFRR
jgi:hypothetical protein